MLLVAVSCTLVRAEGPGRASSAGAHGDACVDVSINDRPVLAYACLNRRLAPVASSPVSADLVAPVARDPSNRQVGQFNFSSFSHRMGDQLGKSVQPQRPPPPAPPPLLGVGR